ncbi:TRAP transporter substrate-binding protein [Mangrovicoccus algicola]|uniref:TRAP transporter substrate-binding protein n=1 Tax=Mangrovicoccus algicola TaxID=2771008 RepID=A0A8J6YXW4_9RHOB|nr:TRAP transporter substrate-binding protein [Mangrovicoccus algicola]MBE3637941.1 TRAP transporter substrate-binding protein [Mangrovicoccus algicola]
MTRTILGLAALLASTAIAQADTLRFAYASNATPTIEAMDKFAELVEEKTGGDVTVQFFPDGQLGGERELVEMVKGGLLDMTKVSGGLMESFAPIYGVFSMPYLFDDEAHFYTAMDKPEVMDPVYQATADQGFVGLTYYNSGARSFYLKDGPVKTVEDLKGKKIRVMQSPTSIAMVEMLGAAPIAMGQAEVYTSIQQDVLDGAENNEYALTVARHGEVAKYYTYDQHSRIPDVVLISTAALDRLSEENRAAVVAAAEESTEFHKQVWGEAIEAEKAKAEEMGVEFFDTDVAQFQEAVAPMYEALKSEPEKYALFEAIRAEADD